MKKLTRKAKYPASQLREIVGQKQHSVIKEATKATKAEDKADEEGLPVEEWLDISLENSIYKNSAGAEQAHKIQLHIL